MIKNKICTGNTFLGIELGSTRIKASLIDDTYTPIASGSFEWENSFEDGYWTYSLESIHKGIQARFQNLSKKIYKEFDVHLEKVCAIGVSAMMHGYLAFDKDDNLLAAFMMNSDDISLGEWLNERVFAKMKNTVVKPNENGVNGFKKYLGRYKLALDAEKKLEDVSC